MADDPSLDDSLRPSQLSTFLRELARSPAVDPSPLLPSWVTSADPALAGQTLGHFRIVEQLGRGGMGVVLLAEDLRLHRRVALKVLPGTLSTDAHRRELLLNEARLAASIHHPNVVTIHEVGVVEELVFVAMEHLEGGSLRELLDQRRLGLDEVLSFSAQLCAGLAAAHRKGVLHCDLKPQNVLVTSGTAKLADFGLAQLHTATTPARAVGGTPRYMPPEQSAGTIDARADVYSLGLLMLEMLLGELLPRTDRTLASVMVRLRLLRRLGPGSRAGALARLATECIDEDPSRRPSSAVEVEQKLKRALLRARRVGRAALVGASAFTLAIALGISASERPAPPLAISERRLTANPANRPMRMAALSSDGAMFAFIDAQGLHQRSLADATTTTRVLPPGFTAHALAVPNDGMPVVLGGFADAPERELLRFGPGEPERLGGGLPSAAISTLSPDGLWLAWAEPDAVRARPIDGDAVRLTTLAQNERIGALAWSPLARRLAYVKVRADLSDLEMQIETVALDGRAAERVLISPRLLQESGSMALSWNPSGHLVYALAEVPPAEPGSTLWRVEISEETGQAKTPERLWRSTPGVVDALFASSSDSALFLRVDTQLDVYVGDVGLKRLTNVRRLSVSDRNQRPTAWLTDDSLLTLTDEAGSIDLYLQPLDGSAAVPFAVGPGDQTWAARDGETTLYWEVDRAEAMPRLMRKAADGTSSKVLELPAMQAPGGVGYPPPRTAFVRCPRTPGGCILGRLEDGVLVFYAIDDVASGQPLGRVALSRGVRGWDVSRDGKRIAVPTDASTVALLTLRTGRLEYRALPPGCSAQYVSFAPDRDALFVSSFCTSSPTYRIDRLTAGGSTLLWSSESDWLGHPVMSPDGKRLAFAVKPFDDDAWLISYASR